jgi:hypothetical protein
VRLPGRYLGRSFPIPRPRSLRPPD